MAEALIDKKSYERNTFTSEHRLICALAASGLNQGQIADALKCSTTTVAIILNDPRGKEARAKYSTEITRKITSEVGEVIAGSALEAIFTIIDIMRNAKSDDTRLRAAIEMKDTAGFMPVRKVISGNMSIPASKEDAAIIRETLREITAEIPVYEDVENSAEALGIDPNMIGSNADN